MFRNCPLTYFPISFERQFLLESQFLLQGQFLLVGQFLLEGQFSNANVQKSTVQFYPSRKFPKYNREESGFLSFQSRFASMQVVFYFWSWVCMKWLVFLSLCTLSVFPPSLYLSLFVTLPLFMYRPKEYFFYYLYFFFFTFDFYLQRRSITIRVLAHLYLVL
uniref:Uncharacterized protein n=1 Tax=Cacopsylla melanoneura TaxID=428564 RepID=A0A8D9BJ62_9HEMI